MNTKLFIVAVLCLLSVTAVFAASSSIASGATLQTTAALNIRASPCTNAKILTTAANGASVTFTGSVQTGCGYTWYSVNASGHRGYAVRDFLKEKSNNGGGGGGSNTGASISVDALRKIMPNLSSSKANQYVGYLNSALQAGSINTCCRKSAFLAQLAHESGDLNWFVEFASGAAYEGRKDLGNTHPGDGVRYKGRGPIQITGRANYRAAGRAIGVDLENNPTRAADPDIGFRTAVWFWNSRSLNQYADQCNQSGFDITTRRVNGGYNGKADRDAHWARAKRVLGC